MVAIGLTDKLAFATALVPTKVVKPASEYHFQLAPVPRLPPVWVKVVLLPLQIVFGEPINEVGATEDWFTVTVTLPAAATLAAQGAPVELSARK